MKNKISLFSLLILFFVEFYLGFFFYPKYRNQGTEATISWDVAGYYMYLPALFIYKDIRHCVFQDSIIAKYHPIPNFDHAAFKYASGNFVMKYAAGQAIILSPAFFTAHIIASNSKSYPADGFSYPYQLAISIWTLMISILGLLLLRKNLLEYFDDWSVALTLISIVLCSNYLEYAAISGGLTHNSLFTIYGLILFFSIRFYKGPKLLDAMAIGFFCGLATLTRPTEIISILIPLVWGISSREAIMERLRLFKNHWNIVVISVMTFACLGIIQIFYWKYVSGHFVVYSYQEQGFDWFRPHIINCLISAKAGWILYSPVFVFAFIGFALLLKKRPTYLLGALLFLVPFTYLCFSWSEWWYGWSLGQRAMIQSYPLWAFGLAAFYQYMQAIRLLFNAVVWILLTIFVLYNTWCIRSSHHLGLLRGPEMTGAYYFEILGKSSIDKSMLCLLDNEDYYRKPIVHNDTLYFNSFNSDSSAIASDVDSMGVNKVLVLDDYYEKSLEYTYRFRATKEIHWYRISAEIHCISKEWSSWDMPKFVVKYKKQGQTIKQNLLRIDRLIEEGETKRIVVFSKPHRNDFDAVTIQFDNSNTNKRIEIDNLLVESIIE